MANEFKVKNGLIVSGTITSTGVLTVDTDILTRSKLQISNGRLFELIGTSTALNIYDASAGASRIYITDSGNIGIGTNTPNSWAQLETTGTVAIGGILYIKSSQKIQGLTGFPGSAGNLSINPDGGNVGIGLTTPQKKLDVYGSAGIVGSFGAGLSVGQFAGIHFGYTESHLNNDSYKKSALVFERTDNNNQGSNASGKIHFLLNNAGGSSATALTASVVTIDSDANGTLGSVRMGIGTKNPIYPLQVVGSAYVNGGTLFIDSGQYLMWGNSNQGIRGVNDTSLDFLVGSAIRMTATAGGNVGIGTTSPAEKLVVAGGGNIATQVEHTNVGWFRIKNTSTGNYWHMEHDYGDNDLRFGTSVSNGLLTLLSNGNVGIGTVSPNEKLDVRGNIYLPQNNYIYFDNSGHYIRRGSSDVEIQGYNGIQLRTNSTTRVYINQSGNVGIGTTSPGEKLHVYNGSILIEDGYALRSGGSYGASLIGRAVGAASAITVGSGQAGDYLVLNSGGSERVRIDTSGNVGIGTASPGAKLHVVGASILANNSSINPDNYSNTVIAGAIGTVGGWALSSAIGGNAGTGHSWAIGTNGDNLYMGYSNGSSSNSMLTFLQVDDSTRNVFLVPSAGNVGISTTSPSEKLDVLGNIKIYNETGLITDYGPLVGRYNTSQVYVGTGGNYSIVKIGRADGGALNVLSGGDVGIGSTTTSGYKLYVNGSTWINGGTNFTDGVSIFRTQSGAAEVMRIASNSNVGIGINSPQTKLDVFGVDNAPALRLSFPSGNTLNTYTGIVFSGETAKAGILFASNAAGYARGSLIFATSNSNDYTGINLTHEKMRITDTGNIGIGTTNPSYRLDVTGGDVRLSQDYSKVKINGIDLLGYGNGVLWQLGNTNYSSFALSTDWNWDTQVEFRYTPGTTGAASGILQIGQRDKNSATWTHGITSFLTNGTEAMRINSAGKVSIGTTDTNSDKSDFTVYTGGTTTLALSGNLLRVGDTDVNWSVALRSNGVLETYGQNLYLGSAAGNYPVTINPNGTNSVSFYPDYTLFNGLNLAISRTNSTHGAANYFRGDSSHLVIGTGGTLYLNYGGSATNITGNVTITGGIGQNNLVGRPYAVWGANGTTTGAVVIKFPGNTSNYGMVHAVIDIYEYNGNTVSTVIVGGHNWGGSQWYAYGANLVGQTDKQVRVAIVDGAYAIVIGDNSSSWSYGQVVLRKIQNGSYYANAMNVSEGYTVTQTASLSPAWISGDLRQLTVSGVITASGGNSNNWNTAYNWGNHSGLYLPLGGGTLTGDLNLNYGYPRINFYDNGNNPDYSLINNDGDFSLYDITNNVHRLWVSAVGNVGIGTTSPAQKLSVAGNIETVSGTGVKIGFNVADAFTAYGNSVAHYGISYNYGSSPLALSGYFGLGLFTNGTERLSITNPGNVGIGTTSPGAKLEVATPASGSTMLVGRAGGNSSIKSLSDNGGYLALDSTGGELILNHYSSANVWLATGGGNVGIGTSGPSYKLHVNGTGYVSSTLTIGSTTNIAAAAWLQFNGSNVLLGEGTHTYLQANGGGSIIFRNNTPSTLMTLNNGGNLGINTLNPLEKLHVSGAAIFDGGAGNSSTDAVVYITKSTNDDWGLYVNNAGLDYGMYTRTSPSANYAFAIHNGTTWTTRITGNGTVFLGEKNAIEGNSDSWLRLNNSNHYTSGVYTPGVMRADGGFYVSGNTVIHSGTIGSQSVSYANSAGSASTAATATDGLRLLREDNRTISPSELTAGYLKFGFTSWANDNSGPYADFLHLRSYTDASGGDDNLVMFKKSGIGMRIYQQTFGSATAYSSYADVWTTVNFTQSNVNNWNTAYGWGNHASQGYATTSYVTTQINNLINGAPGALDTLSELASALGNDASFATTVTNSIAGKVSKSGDTMTGNLTLAGGTNILFTGGSHAIAGNNTGYLHFYDYTNVYFNNQLVIRGGIQNDGGNVLIDDNLNVNGELAFPDGAGAYSNIIRSAPYPSEGYPSGLNFWMEYRAKGGHHFILNTDGGVGAGLASMDDFVIWQGAIDGNRLLEVSNIGNLWIAGALTEASSLKLKENVETSEGNLEKVVNLRPVTYNKIGSQTTELGLIAEEVAEVYPEFVQYDENGEPVGVHYSRLTAALIGAVKELTNQVQELNKKING